MNQDLGAIPTQLADAFGLVIESRDMKGDHSLFTQTIHTLQQAVQPGNHLDSRWQFSAQDYKEVNKLSAIDVPNTLKFTLKKVWFCVAEIFSASCSCSEFGGGAQP